MSDYLNLFSRLRKDYKSIDLDKKCDKNGSLQNVTTKCHKKLSLQNSVPVTVVTDVYESHTSPFFCPISSTHHLAAECGKPYSICHIIRLTDVCT